MKKCSLELAELRSPDQCRSVLMKKRTVTCFRDRRIITNAAKSQEVLNMERSLRNMLRLTPDANATFKLSDSGNLID